MSGRYEVLAHTADVGISTSAGSLNALIGNAGFAMFDLMYDLDAATPTTSMRFELTIAPPADLLVKVLGELLYRSEVEELAFTHVRVRTTGDRLVVEAAGIPTNRLDLHGTPIKAVTYHDLICEETPNGWRARLIFDV